MKATIATLGLAVLTVTAAPALANQSRLSEILFGKAYDDDIIAIQVAPIYGQGDGPDRSIYTHSPASIRAAQTAARQDPVLLGALAVRGIKLHNVLKIRTAGNGGKVVYYR
jgi:hypothetical protein